METSQTIEKTMLILQILAEKEQCSAAAVTKKLGVHRSTTYRMLKSLVQLGYVEHHENTGLYGLSSKIENLIHPKTSYSWLKEIAGPHMEEFHSRVNETLHLAVLNKGELCYLSKWETTRSLRVVIQSRTGGHAPLHCTGLGKMLLSGEDKESLKTLLTNLPFTVFTDNTISNIDSFRRELEKTSLRGYSFDNEEHEEGVCCIAVPLLNSDRKMTGAISITVPRARFTDERKSELLRGIQAVGKEISDEIGSKGF